jgi:hypothetical protein
MPRRTTEQREVDLVKLAHGYLRGVLQKDMAVEFGVSGVQIHDDIKELHKRWRESQIINFNEAKVIELAKIDAIEQEAWAAWRRTIGKMKKYKHAEGEKGKSKERVMWHEAGDPRFLTVMQTCVDKRCAILGLDAPKKIAPTDPTGERPYRVAVRELSDEQLKIVSRMRHIVSSDKCEPN